MPHNLDLVPGSPLSCPEDVADPPDDAASESEDRVFTGGVRGQHGVGAHRQYGGDVDDASSAAVSQHRCCDVFAHPEGAAHVRQVDEVPVLVGGLQKAPFDLTPSIVTTKSSVPEVVSTCLRASIALGSSVTSVSTTMTAPYRSWAICAVSAICRRSGSGLRHWRRGLGRRQNRCPAETTGSAGNESGSSCERACVSSRYGSRSEDPLRDNRSRRVETGRSSGSTNVSVTV